MAPSERRSLFRALGFRLIAALLLALAGGPATRAADGTDDETAKFLWSRYGSGQYRDAAEGARAVLEEDPRNLDAIDVLAGSLESSGDEALAEKELTETAGLPPTRTAALLRLGEHLALRGRAEEALPHLQKALEEPALRVRARAALAQALVELGRRDEGSVELKKLFRDYQAIPAESIGARDWIALARAALAAERIPALQKEHVRPFAADARNFFQKAYEADPTQADTLVLWARIYLEKWDLVEAKRLAKEALKRNSRHAAGNALLAELLLSDFYGGAGRYEEARRAVDAALATDPGCPDAHLITAELALSDGLLDDALSACQRALLRRPLDPRALGTAAAIRFLKGDADALMALEKALVPRGTSLAAQALAEASGVHDRRFGYRRAYEVARRAVELDPGCLPARRQLGFAAMRVGDEAAAKEHLDFVHEADPFDLFTYNQLTLLDYLEKEYSTDRTTRFVLRVHKGETQSLRPYLKELLDRSWDELSARYQVTLDSPILVEVYPSLSDFSVRAVAHRFIPASGVTFARVVALASPAAFPPGTHGWGRVLWHELAHVATLERSGYKVPRWLTEGLSVLEESKGHPAWIREWDAELVDALARGRLLPIEELNGGFSKPRFPNQVMLSYYQGGLLCGFIEQTWGFPALLALLDGYREGLSLKENLARALDGITPAELDRRFLAHAKGLFATIPYRPACYDATELAALRKEARERPKDARALARYALACADMERWADAEAAAGALLKVDPDSGDVLLVRALVARHRGDMPLALSAAGAALAAGTSDPFLANTLLYRHYALDPESKAVRDLRKAHAAVETLHRLFPRHPGYLQELVNLTKEKGLETRHLEVLRDLAAVTPDNIAARAELVLSAEKRKDPAEAAKWLEEMLWLDPRNPWLHLRYAVALASIGGLTEARRELAVFEILDPELAKDPEVLKELRAVGLVPTTSPGKHPSAPSGTAQPEGPTPTPPGPAPVTPSAFPKQESF